MTQEENKPREFWVNERTGSASIAEESIDSGYHTHVIEYWAYERLKSENETLKKELQNKDAVRLWNENEQLKAKLESRSSTEDLDRAYRLGFEAGIASVKK